MAGIGLRYYAAAKIATETAGSALTYAAGIIAGKAVSLNITYNRSSNPNYGDDVEVDNDNGLTGINFEATATGFDDATRVYLLGATEKTGSSGQPSTYVMGGDSSPYVGFGFVQVLREAGVVTYKGYWFYKCLFAEESATMNTKGETIEWQNPVLTGRAMGVYDDATGEPHFYEWCTFSGDGAAAAALAWLKGKANIT